MSHRWNTRWQVCEFCGITTGMFENFQRFHGPLPCHGKYAFVGGPADGKWMATQDQPVVFYPEFSDIPISVLSADPVPSSIDLTIKIAEYLKERRFGVVRYEYVRTR